jgi:hypothetical protein
LQPDSQAEAYATRHGQPRAASPADVKLRGFGKQLMRPRIGMLCGA